MENLDMKNYQVQVVKNLWEYFFKELLFKACVNLFLLPSSSSIRK